MSGHNFLELVHNTDKVYIEIITSVLDGEIIMFTVEPLYSVYSGNPL